MLTVEIPGRGPLALEHLVLDYNGTIARDGAILPEVTSRLEELSHMLTIHVITADTHGTAARCCRELPVRLFACPCAEAGRIKGEYVRGLTGGAACIGNGFNDIPMSDACALSVAVIGAEGCCAGLLAHADVAVACIGDGLDLFLHPDRLRATLRT